VNEEFCILQQTFTRHLRLSRKLNTALLQIYWLQKLIKYFKYTIEKNNHTNRVFTLTQRFPSILLANPFWFRKITTNPYLLVHINFECPDDMYPKLKICISEVIFRYLPGHAVAQLVEALRYKPEGRGFDSRWWH
jgi:hypothetical protein